MSMRELKEIDDMREIVKNVGSYPKLVLVLVRDRVNNLLDRLDGEHCKELIEELVGVKNILDASIK